MWSTSRGARRTAATLLAVSALAVAGCGGPGAGEAGGSGDSGGDRALTVWIMEGTNPDARPFFDELSTAFRNQTGATLDVQFVSWASAHDKFVTSIAGGTTPDVAEVGTTWTGEFGEAGALADLAPRVQEAGLANGLVTGLTEAGTVGDALYGMPWYAGVRSIVYRTDVFAEAGVTPPTTWEELAAAGEKIKAARPDLIPFPIAGDNEYGVYPFVWGAGGEIAAQNGGTWTSTLDSPQARQGIQFYADLALKHGLSTPAAATWKETDLQDSFSKGQSAMIISGSWTPKAILEAAPDLQGKIGAFPIPGPTGGLSPSFLGGSHLSIFEGSPNQDLAWQLVQLMSTGDFAAKWGSESSFFPGTTALLQQAAQSSDPLVAPFAKQMVDAGRSVPVTPLYGQVQGKKTIPAMMSAILGGTPVDQATSTAVAEMNQIFAGGA
ncbi:sugar ABC transporter substrate-binding protein [Pseudonocardia xinjiangensis]|uniref:Sugar ABC transporter substrate-binding protein n=1 Tax=Pseudonocardia xinjiangensis TaxID=75289 RepID=A0ABX1RCY9_9PSEU|nr:sugar ABC transporter substrate-binding protein [Pseudonocardia xinjiangensis]NMH76985.1 sugar ABC transporter substrate-binding protein [Pseudonocardia xinjiangensis]